LEVLCLPQGNKFIKTVTACSVFGCLICAFLAKCNSILRFFFDKRKSCSAKALIISYAFLDKMLNL
ncbi:MAG: hypothetical protein WCU80_09175, partial [Paludibacteraceae bacterium]